MKKSTLLTLLLVSAICQFADALTGFFLLDFISLGSIVLSIIFMVNAKKVFGDEVKNANNSCLWSIIANGVSVLLGNTVGLLIIAVTIGIGALIVEPFDSLLNIGFGLWQIMAWSKLRPYAQDTVIAA